MILDEAFNILLSRFTTGIEVKEWCVLKRYVVLELSSGVCGVAYYPHDVTPKIPNFRAKDPIKAARLYRSRVAGRRAIGVAVLNALTWALKPIPLGSATHLIRLMCGKRVAMVAGRRAIGVAVLHALTWALKPIPLFRIGDPLDTLDVW
jgi:hypothetical protein